MPRFFETLKEFASQTSMIMNDINDTFLSNELDRLINVAKESGDDESRITFVVLKTIYEDVRQLRTQVNSNPFYSLGNFIRSNPRTFAILLAIVFIILNAWFVSGWRRPLLIWLGIPEELIP